MTTLRYTFLLACFAFLRLSLCYQRMICNDDQSLCDCVRGWVGENCEQPDYRPPTPCVFVPRVRYFKYRGYPLAHLKQLKCRAKRLSNFNRIVVRGDTQWVDLGYNNIGADVESIRDNMIAYMPELKAIKIDRSRVTKLVGDFLARNPKLEQVDFKENFIQVLPEELFANNSKLVKVTLNENPFTVLPRNLFKNNPELRELRVSFTRITRLPSDLFQLNSNFRYLDASFCLDLQYLSARMFQSTPLIEFVGLRNTWFLEPRMRKHFCDMGWCVRSGYPPVSALLTLLRQYFD